jgi:hypothetical protein
LLSPIWLIAVLCASALADDNADKLRQIDERREALRREVDEVRRDEALDRMSRSIRLTELNLELFMLDYDDSRTRLGATVAMPDVSDEELVELLYDLVLARAPTPEQMKLCTDYLAKQPIRRASVCEIVHSLCNTREFIELIGK